MRFWQLLKNRILQGRDSGFFKRHRYYLNNCNWRQRLASRPVEGRNQSAAWLKRWHTVCSKCDVGELPGSFGLSMRVVIAGMGVAGSAIAAALGELPGVDLVCLERVDRADHAHAGNGLNIGPNAVTALRASMPALARALEQVSLPWRSWRASTIEGELLMQVPLAEVACDAGLRIRWSDLYGVCRSAAGSGITYRSEALTASVTGASVLVSAQRDGTVQPLPPADLLVVADGRFSSLRAQLGEPPRLRHLGVANFRVLLDDGGKLPIDDLEQWYTGPHRLLAFRLRDGLIYLSGNLPLTPGAEIPPEMKTADYLASAYIPSGCRAAEVPAWLVHSACAAVEQHHWARAQEVTGCYSAAGGHVMFVGDAAHAMAPTLGQGATLALEDASAFVNLFRDAWAGEAGGNQSINVKQFAAAFERLRRTRVDYIRQLSWDAADSLLLGADAVNLVRAKGGEEWLGHFRKMYSDVPLPGRPTYRRAG